MDILFVYEADFLYRQNEWSGYTVIYKMVNKNTISLNWCLIQDFTGMTNKPSHLTYLYSSVYILYQTMVYLNAVIAVKFSGLNDQT